VVRCPKCGTELDVDEDEVEEGEILTCSECEVALEVVQTHPVKLNAISDEEDEEEDDEDEEEGAKKKKEVPDEEDDEE